MISQREPELTDAGSAVLASSRRRLILYYVIEHNGELDLEELSRKIATAEAGLLTLTADPDAVRRVRDTLYVTHLPILIENGLVEYDYDTGVIQATDKLDDVLRSADNPWTEHRRWLSYYLVPAVVLSLVVLAYNLEIVEIGVPVLLSGTIIGIVTLVLLPVKKHVYAPQK